MGLTLGRMGMTLVKMGLVRMGLLQLRMDLMRVRMSRIRKRMGWTLARFRLLPAGMNLPQLKKCMKNPSQKVIAITTAKPLICNLAGGELKRFYPSFIICM